MDLIINCFHNFFHRCSTYNYHLKRGYVRIIQQLCSQYKYQQRKNKDESNDQGQGRCFRLTVSVPLAVLPSMVCNTCRLKM